MYKGALLKFIFGSLLAAAISSFILFPTIYGLQSITRLKVEKSWFNFSFGPDLFKNVFGRFLIGSNNINSILAIETPCLYCGMLTLILVFFYFMNENIKNKDNARLLKLIQQLFLLKRKNILNNLVNVTHDKDFSKEILDKLNVDVNKRPEQLDINFYINVLKLIDERVD